MTKHLNRSIVTDEDILAEKCQSRYFKQSQQIMNEENIVAGHLLSERKTKIDESHKDGINTSLRLCIAEFNQLNQARKDLITANIREPAVICANGIKKLEKNNSFPLT